MLLAQKVVIDCSNMMSRHTFEDDTVNYSHSRGHRLSGHSSFTNSQIMDRPLSRPPSELVSIKPVKIQRCKISFWLSSKHSSCLSMSQLNIFLFCDQCLESDTVQTLLFKNVGALLNFYSYQVFVYFPFICIIYTKHFISQSQLHSGEN